MSSANLIMKISTAAIAFAENKTNEQLQLAASIVTQFADTLATIAAQRELCAEEKEEDKVN